MLDNVPPERVVWAPSPLAGAFAAPIAACLVTGHRNRRVLESVHRAIEETAGEAIATAVRTAVQSATGGPVSGPVSDTASDTASDTVRDTVRGTVSGTVRGTASGTVHGAAATALHTEMAAVLSRALATESPGPADEADRPVIAKPPPGVAEAATAAVLAGVDAAVGGPRQDTIRGEVRRLWRAHLQSHRSGAWLEHVGDAAPEGWWWWPFRDFVLFSEGPSELRLEQTGEGSWATQRPHRADGPAVAWPDGFELCFWHGTHVPRAVIDDTLTAQEILREPNAEIRRCAIERRGWDRFTVEARLEQLGPAVPDPGNPGQTLTLHDVPDGVYTTPVRVLLCTNGTVERDGTRRRFGLTVPTHCGDPIEAAAWTYGLSAAQYATAQRRS
ncbi:hypothetical protein GCM10009850_057250 [Nonomuraea monospora]|uniref:DUF6745 domain-containing protein n=1 Tax=Nonomuraea monospora TaxID=568818 RepID=A0ABN3CLC0_9ACTN